MKKVLFLMSVFLFLLSGAVLAQQSRMLSVEKIKTERAALKKQSFDYKSLKWNRIKKTDQYQAKVDTEDSKTPYREVTPLSRIPSQTTILTTQKDRMSAEKAIRNRGPIELRDRTDRDGQIHNMMPLRRWRRR